MKREMKGHHCHGSSCDVCAVISSLEAKIRKLREALRQFDAFMVDREECLCSDRVGLGDGAKHHRVGCPMVTAREALARPFRWDA